MRKKSISHFFKYGLLLFCCLLSTYAVAQSTISGRVVTEDGEGILGANVLLKGTGVGTTTDINGDYQLDVPDDQGTLVISYVGYTTQEVPIGGETTINITLFEDLSALEEVVVIGYGTAKKSDITGAVSSVGAEELNAFPVQTVQQALQGRAAGVAVSTSNGGEPGAPINIRVRGNTSIGASSAALIVVDGFIAGSLPPPTDIESIEILKDASATAIYGARGANGVILVTTKKGREGKTRVEINSSYAFQSTTDRLDLLNADQFVAYQQEINPNFEGGGANTDWQDLIYQNGATQQHQVSVSGGGNGINFYTSLNYFDQEGVVINSNFDRFSITGNVQAQATERLQLGANLFIARSEKDGISSQADTGGTGSGDVISLAARFNPSLGIRDASGNFTQNDVGDTVDNPFAVATEEIENTKRDVARINVSGEFDIVDGLSIKSTLGFNSTNQTLGTYSPSTLLSGANGGEATIENARTTNVLTETYLNYEKTFGKLEFAGLLGYSHQNELREDSFAGAQNFITDSGSFNALQQGSVPLPSQSERTERIFQSQFGRVNFTYDDKYLLTATLRRDGSSVFAENEKYALFPSAAIGWKISSEPFLSESEKISNLKLRASYGATGNPAIGAYASLAAFESIYAVTGDQTVNAVVPLQIANPDLKWETTYQGNLGVDLGFLRDRITMSVDLYNMDTEDLILGDSGLPEYFGFLNLDRLVNVGEINNRGVEIVFTSRNIVKEDFTWTTDLNFSRNVNEVVSLINGEDIFLDASPGSFLIDQTHLLREGEPVGVFYGYEYRGVNTTGTAPAGTATFDSDAAAGGELYTDINNDGMLNDDDRKIIGDPNQDFTFGINNTFRYKDFDLNVFFQGAVGGDIYSFTFSELAGGAANATTEVLDRWSPSNTDGSVPSAAVRAQRVSSRFVYDGSYVRLKNIALGYNVPESASNSLGFDSIRLGVSAQNLLTFTDYPGVDPEVSYKNRGNNLQSNTSQGFEYGNFPNVKSVTFSLGLRF
ncbi:SusC/RagA family TonB-linked outer membrane protein [Nonlabens xiamenensis]|uniref:SusC/RagA family TonB-linked outer membrane protein n=1 Tax=Nonlabens xiamenensis TaxID=2341043 RepID=UPI000F60503B|nr:TonB-dependent receptor [Nonlabens xiamenensis]